MSVRSLNKVILIGNLTRDPELRYTPAGTAVCTFGVATNRQWTTQTGETKEETEFHRIVSWNKLGELCSQLLSKGRKVYVEGRLATHSWTAQDGTQRTTTEVVIDDMIILDSKKKITDNTEASQLSPDRAVKEPESRVVSDQPQAEAEVKEDKDSGKKDKKAVKEEQKTSEEITPDDIPF